MDKTEDDLDLARCGLALVMNAAAGRKDARDREATIRERLEPHVRELKIHAVEKGSAIIGAARRALDSGAEVVAALGGDGTQSAVAGVLAGSGAVMAVLPGGTFNYFARELGMETLEAALDAILGGHVRRLDVADVNGRVFLNNASFGVYPEILETREAIYRRWGRSRVAAYWSVVVALRQMRDPMHLTLTVDGVKRELHTPLAFAARSAFQLERLGIDGADAVRDGQFALFIAHGQRPRELMAAAVRLALGRVAKGQDFDLVVADDILIETRHKRRLIAFDGEKERLAGPFRLRVRPGDLRVLVPREVPAEGPEADAGVVAA